VAAAVSLLKGVYPRLNATEARRILTASADPSARCADPTDPTKLGCGAGLLDVDAAIVLAQEAEATGGINHDHNVVTGGYGCTVGGVGGGAGDTTSPSATALLLLLLSIAALRRRVL